MRRGSAQRAPPDVASDTHESDELRHDVSSRTLACTWPAAHHASKRDSCVSLRNLTSTCAPPSDEPVSTQNPLFGVAHLSDICPPVQLRFAVPPMRANVRLVVAGCGGGVLGLGRFG